MKVLTDTKLQYLLDLLKDKIYTKLDAKVNTSDYNPDAKTSAMTQAVGKDNSGKLWTISGGSTIIPKITLGTSQVVSTSPTRIQLTNEQATIIENPANGIIEIDAVALDIIDGYALRNKKIEGGTGINFVIPFTTNSSTDVVGMGFYHISYNSNNKQAVLRQGDIDLTGADAGNIADDDE